MTNNQPVQGLPSGLTDLERYRPSMDVEVLRSWAEDAQAVVDAQSAQIKRHSETIGEMAYLIRQSHQGLGQLLYEQPLRAGQYTSSGCETLGNLVIQLKGVVDKFPPATPTKDSPEFYQTTKSMVADVLRQFGWSSSLHPNEDPMVAFWHGTLNQMRISNGALLAGGNDTAREAAAKTEIARQLVLGINRAKLLNVKAESDE